MQFLGIDTSNYTTSAALYDTSTNTLIQKKKLLPVKDGEKGLRQSDAVFHHTVQLPQLEWKAGKIYTYTLLVNKSDIEVSVTIEPWLTKQVPVDIYL